MVPVGPRRPTIRLRLKWVLRGRVRVSSIAYAIRAMRSADRCESHLLAAASVANNIAISNLAPACVPKCN